MRKILLLIVLLDCCRFAGAQDNALLLPVIVDDQWGFIDAAGNVRISPQYDDVSTLIYDRYIVVEKNGRKGLINFKYKEVLPLVYDEIIVNQVSRTFSNIPYDYLVIHKRNGKFGCSDPEGKLLLENAYAEIRLNSVLTVKRNLQDDFCLPVFLNKGAVIITNIKIKEIYKGGGNYIFESDNFLYGLADDAGNVIIPPVYNLIKYAGYGLYSIEKNGKCGISDSLGNIKIAAIYDEILAFKNRLALIIDSGKYGLINDQSKVILEPDYDKISANDLKVKAKYGNKLVILDIDEQGNVIEKSEYENVNTITVAGVTSYNGPVVPLGVADTFYIHPLWFYSDSLRRWGLHDEAGQVIISPRFKRVYSCRNTDFSLVEIAQKDSLYALRRSWQVNSKFGIINHKTGEVILNLSFFSISVEDFYDVNSAIIRCYSKSAGMGYLDKYPSFGFHKVAYIDKGSGGVFRVIFTGKIFHDDVISRPAASYMVNFSDYFNSFSELPKGASRWNYYNYCSEGNWGYLRSSGNYVDRMQYAGPFRYNRGIARKAGKWGVIDEKLNTIIPFEYDSIEAMNYADSSIFRLFMKNKKFGLMDEKGKVITDMLYEDIGPYYEGYAAAKKKGLYGYINEEGKEITEFIYKRVSLYSENLAGVKISSKWGYIDSEGKMMIEPLFVKAGVFGEGLAFAATNKKSGFIDVSGNFLFEVRCSHATKFHNGTAWVKVSGKYGLIDHEGKWVLRPKYLSLQPYDNTGELMIVRGEKGYEILNSKGESLSSEKLDYINKSATNGFAIFKKGSKYGYLDGNGQIAISALYDMACDFYLGYAVVKQGANFLIIDTLGNDPANLIKLDEAGMESIADTGAIHRIRFNSSEINRRLNNKIYLVQDIVEKKKYYLKTSYERYQRYYLDVDLETVAYAGQTRIYRNYRDKYSLRKESKFSYDRIVSLSTDRFKYHQNYVYRVADWSGRIISPIEFESIEYYGHNIFRLKYRNSICYLKKDGTWLWKPE